jgi:hypothetical protein
VRTHAILAAVLVAACDKSSAPPPSNTSAAAAATATAASTDSGCPATGLWAECSLLYRLDRAGLAPHIDSGATPNEKELTGKRIMLKIGLSAELELYLYPDSSARITDALRLDRSRFVNATATQTIARERTLMESVNLLGLLTSLNSHQRERVSDALTAGPPQPASQSASQKLPPSKSK